MGLDQYAHLRGRKINWDKYYSDDEKVILTLNRKKKNIIFNFCQKTLKYQLFNFLNTKKYSKNYCLNDIRNFDNLFYLIKNIR